MVQNLRFFGQELLFLEIVRLKNLIKILNIILLKPKTTAQKKGPNKNDSPYPRRSRGKRAVLMAVSLFVVVEPTSYKQALSSTNALEWKSYCMKRWSQCGQTTYKT